MPPECTAKRQSSVLACLRYSFAGTIPAITGEQKSAGGLHFPPVVTGSRWFEPRGGLHVKTLIVPPGPSLLESMRSVGYSVESAVADVIDNSVAAQANNVAILVSDSGPFQMAILDDGTGMSRDQAIAAMTLAAVSPTAERAPGDLGRFGLGLKTASLSQCRTLTIITRSAGSTTALRWSLDHVISTGAWSLLELDEDDLPSLLGWNCLDALPHGTLVHWGDLDQLATTEGDSQDDLDRVAVHVRAHVALVFHLFNGSEGVRNVDMTMNGSPIARIDPFMQRRSTASPWESIEVEGQTVKLIAYTLPYLSRLSTADRERALQLGGLRETQGFYVYRGHRLVIWGNWFRVMPRSEMAKLTRVRVDIPNTLDHLWALDVKKSHAEPPPLVRRRLSELAKKMMEPSQRVQQFRGRKVHQATGITHMWQPIVNGDHFHYTINPEHPTITTFFGGLGSALQAEFARVLEDIQSTFPVVDAHNRLSGDSVPSDPDDDDLVQRANSAWSLARELGLDRDAFITSISHSEPYNSVQDIEAKLRKATQS